MERLPGIGSSQPTKRMSCTSHKIVATCFCVFNNGLDFLGCRLVACFFFFGYFVQNSQLVPLAKQVKTLFGSTSCCARRFLQVLTRFIYVVVWVLEAPTVRTSSSFLNGHAKTTAIILSRPLSLPASRRMLCAGSLLLNPTRLPHLLLYVMLLIVMAKIVLFHSVLLLPSQSMYPGYRTYHCVY